MTIVTKIVLIVTIPVALTIGGVSFVTSRQIQSVVRQQIDRVLETNLEFAAQEIIGTRDNIHRTVEIVAQNHAVGEALDLLVSRGLNQILNEVVAVYPSFNYVLIAEPNGEIFAANTRDSREQKIAGEMLLGRNIRENPLFPKTSPDDTVVGKPGRDSFQSLIGTDTGLGQWFVTPVRKGGQIISWVVLSYAWEREMSALLTKITRNLVSIGNPTIETILTDTDGNIVVGGAECSGRFNGDSSSIWKTREITFAGEPMNLIIVNDLAKTDRPTAEAQTFMLWVGLLTGLFLIAVLYVMLRKTLLQRLRVLHQGTEMLGSGSLTFRLPELGKDEIGLLGAAFNDMAAKLDATSKKERELQKELREAQKLEAVGQLAGGIAHEINTPSQYIGDNLKFLSDAHEDIFSLIDKCMVLTEAARGHDGFSALAEEVDAVRDRIDLEYLREEMPSATEQSLSGIGQVSRIVLAMKEFSHPGTKEKSLADINRALENTLTISRNEWKHVAEVTTAFDEALPAVSCMAGELNQVFLNLIVNAAHAIKEKPERHGMGRIKVSTETDGDSVIIRIEDNGTGIPEEVRDKVFNPFFTTKEVGQGSGQGLAIARDIVVNKHGGTIGFETETGKGTTFIITLPVRATPSARTAPPVTGNGDGASGSEP